MAYKHPSWNWEQWESLWPTRHSEHAEFSTTACSVEFKRLRQSDSDVLAAMTTDTHARPVSLASVRQFSERLERWMQSPIVESEMTLPPSMAGFHRALAYEIESNPSLDLSDGCFAVALIDRRPGDIARALKLVSEDKISADWKILRSQIVLDEKRAVRQDAQTPPPLPKVVVEAPVVSDPPAESVKDESVKSVEPVKASVGFSAIPSKRLNDFSPVQKAHGALFVEWVKQAKSETEVPAIQRQNFDGLVKQNVFKYQGAANTNFNRWLEEFAIGALASLPTENMAEILDLWPTHQSMTFADPVKTISDNNFWQTVRRMKTSPRTYFLETILPTIVSTENWNNETKYDLLPKMLEKTEEYEFLVEERLKLWLAWGGNLDAAVSQKSDQTPSAFDMVETHSARQWIEEQKKPNFTAVLNKLPSPRKSGMSM